MVPGSGTLANSSQNWSQALEPLQITVKIGPRLPHLGKTKKTKKTKNIFWKLFGCWGGGYVPRVSKILVFLIFLVFLVFLVFRSLVAPPPSLPPSLFRPPLPACSGKFHQTDDSWKGKPRKIPLHHYGPPGRPVLKTLYTLRTLFTLDTLWIWKTRRYKNIGFGGGGPHHIYIKRHIVIYMFVRTIFRQR